MKLSVKSCLFGRIIVCIIACSNFNFALANYKEYDLDFVGGGFGKTISESLWIQHGLSPGLHSFNVMLADGNQVLMDVNFLIKNDKIEPCFTREQLESLNINVSSANQCAFVNEISEDASFEIHTNRSLLLLTVPQILMSSNDMMYKTNKKYWDHGENSLKINYSGYAYTDTLSNTSSYLSLNGTASLGRWRIKGNYSYFKNDEIYSYTIGNLFALTDIDSISSRFSFGNIYTRSTDSLNSTLPITGAMLALEDLKFSSSWNTYAPLIKDRVNSTSARVTVLDENRIVFSKVFTTGEFKLSDMDVPAVGSTLKLLIEESDGTVREKNVPFTRLQSQLRQGSYSYHLAAGKYRGKTVGEEPLILNGSFRYGFQTFTPSVDFVVSDDYHYLEVSNTLDLQNYGAISIGAGMSNSSIYNQGYMFKASYAKFISGTDTSIQFAGTQYRSKTFQTFSEHINMSETSLSKKQIFDVSINQKISDYSLYLGFKVNSFYDSIKKKESYYASLNMPIGPANIGLSVSKDSYNNTFDSEFKYGVNVSIPLGKKDKYRLSNNITGSQSGSTLNTISVSNSNSTRDYNAVVSTSFMGSDITHAASSSIRNKTNYGDFDARLDIDNKRSAVTLSGNGGILAYKNGVVFTKQLGDSNAILEFGHGAKGISLNNDTNNVTDGRGIGIIPFSNPYDKNQVNYDISNATNVEVNNFNLNYTPRFGSSVLIEVDSLVGLRRFISINVNQSYFSQPVFASSTNKRVSFVGTDNIVYLSGLSNQIEQEFYVGKDRACIFNVDFSDFTSEFNQVYSVECK